MADYFILAEPDDRRFCAIWEYLDEFPDIENPAEGIAAGGSYPPDVRFAMTPEWPGIRVSDFLKNAFGYLMVTQAGRAALEKHAHASIEFLPFTLLNHKGRVAAKDAAIANVLGTVDCVDEKRTEGARSSFEPDRYLEINRLYLDPERIPKDRDLFRLASLPTVYIVRDDLRAALEREGLTGLSFLAQGDEVELE